MPPTQTPTQPHFTLRGIVEEMTAEGRKSQVIFKSPKVQGLGVRVTPSGAKSFIYDRSIAGKTVRLTIGQAPRTINDSGALSVPEAEAIATALNLEVAAGRDPRMVKAEKSRADEATTKAERAERDRQSLTLREVWDEYLIERSPEWSERHHADAKALASAGGKPHKRGGGKTKPGALASLMKEPVASIDQERIAAWAKVEGVKRQTQARLARRHLIACLRWCMEEGPRAWRGLVQPASLQLNKTARKRLGKPGAKSDRLERSQLPAFFEALAKHPVPVVRAFLVGLLMTGARKKELTGLQWPDIDWRWKRLTVHDKATQETRVIPLSPYMESVLRQLEGNKGKSPWVFQSTRKQEAPLAWANKALSDIAASAGIPHLSVHGLRRSFASLAESADIPAGPIAQIMGHAPQATAERHYKRRTIDELRKFSDLYEAWILEAAGIDFTPDTEGLRLVKH